MKKSIVKRISVTGVLVIVTSLVVFSIFTVILYRTSMEKHINQQLMIENRIAYNLLLVDKLDDAAVYKFLSESTNLVFAKVKGEKGFTLIHSTNVEFNDIRIEIFLKDYIDKGQKVMKYEIHGQRYLMTMSTNKSPDKKANSVILSFISMEEIYALTTNFIWIMILIAVLLSVISIVIFHIMSKKITEPIFKVIEVTKEYENRNFETKYIATTGDEIQELSESVNKMAHSLQQYDLEKEKLFRSISHEIKTPLTSIYGYAEGMKNGVFQDFDKPLTIIMDESMRIKTMTEDYIFLSKLESHIESFNFNDYNLSSIVERAIETIESIAIVQDIDIDYNPVDLPLINCDEDKIYRAILNILTNALKYTKDTIKVTVSNVDDQVVIRIEDNGHGLDQEAIDRFKKGLSSEKNNGSGVGLFITDAIIKHHGGVFKLGNNKEYGAFFEMNIPFSKI